MELDLATKQQLADLLAKPSSVTAAHASLLSNLIEAYPYYQPLHLLLAKASSDAHNSSSTLATATLYNGGELLYQVIHQPENFRQSNLNLPRTIQTEVQKDSEQIESGDDLAVFNTNSEFTDQRHIVAQARDHSSPEGKQDHQETFEEINEFIAPVTHNKAGDEEDIFDEIVEVNTAEFTTTEQITPSEPVSETAITDDLAMENIVTTDFFAFEKSLSSESGAQQDNRSIVPAVEEYDQEAEAQTVSRYDDDKLPYTFLWWLAKTRKEHEQIFQPYVTPKQSVGPVATENPSELQQQYVEHIFHLQTPFTVSEETSNGENPTQVVHRGTEIINLFIKNDPQIRTPKAEQINTENKAKKSAEDHNDMVSETLASIYIEQMLYHKAIDTYEKLSLKFPEKSRYFADLIQSLEKKI